MEKKSSKVILPSSILVTCGLKVRVSFRTLVTGWGGKMMYSRGEGWGRQLSAYFTILKNPRERMGRDSHWFASAKQKGVGEHKM